MNKLFRKSFVNVMRQEFVTNFPSFLERKFSKEEKKSHKAGIPFVLFSNGHPGIEYFVSFFSYRDSKIYVEVGWKSGLLFPQCWAGFDALIEQVRHGTFRWPTSDFATRLFYLCKDRGCAESLWDMYSTEVWDKCKENYRDFENRQDFLATTKAMLDWGKRGGITEEYANSQAALIGCDIVSCLRDYGIPFLEEAMRHHEGATPM
jgi:hypothetical protein